MVFPLPVGAAIRTFFLSQMSLKAYLCGGVSSPKLDLNHSLTYSLSTPRLSSSLKGLSALVIMSLSRLSFRNSTTI